MRDRLIELLKKADKYASGVCTDYDEAQEVCADYLLAEGVIVLPCKVGSTIYRIDTMGVKCSHKNSDFDEYWCGGCPHREIGDCDAREEPYIYVIKNANAQAILGNEHLLGARAFLTREEAEKALAERRGDGT